MAFPPQKKKPFPGAASAFSGSPSESPSDSPSESPASSPSESPASASPGSSSPSNPLMQWAKKRSRG